MERKAHIDKKVGYWDSNGHTRSIVYQDRGNTWKMLSVMFQEHYFKIGSCLVLWVHPCTMSNLMSIRALLSLRGVLMKKLKKEAVQWLSLFFTIGWMGSQGALLSFIHCCSYIGTEVATCKNSWSCFSTSSNEGRLYIPKPKSLSKPLESVSQIVYNVSSIGMPSVLIVLWIGP